MHTFRRVSIGATLLAAAAYIRSSNAVASAAAQMPPHAAATADGWTPLFDGKTTNGWRGYHMKTMPPAWKVVNGVLRKDTATDDIITDKQYGNFELSLDWKLSSGGNSGIFYHVTEEYEHPYWTGPEYQLLDDAGHPDGKSRLTAAGSDYGLYASPAGIVKPAGEWNSARIVVNGAHVEHWLNGTKLLEYTLWSPDWKAKVAASKFGKWPDYGMAKEGYIGIQGDHDGELSLRNIQIKVLP